MTAQRDGKARVLIVEDNELCRLSVSALLKCIGFDVVAVADGESAIEALTDNPQEVSAVLLDVTLPGLSGADTFKALKGISADLPIILTSGYGQSVIDEQFAGTTYDGFVPKPAPADWLNTVLKSVTAPDRANNAGRTLEKAG